jgi:hypothetical protein
MRVHGVRRILTFNEKDFARYPGVEARERYPNPILIAHVGHGKLVE